MKKLFLAVVLLLAMAGMVVPVSARTGSTVQPLYNSISSIDVTISSNHEVCI